MSTRRPPRRGRVLAPWTCAVAVGAAGLLLPGAPARAVVGGTGVDQPNVAEILRPVPGGHAVCTGTLISPAVVAAVHVDPLYDPALAPAQDVALLALQEPVEGVEPMPVLDDVDEVDQTTVLHFGWGSTDVTGALPTVLQMATCTNLTREPILQARLGVPADPALLDTVCWNQGRTYEGDSGGPAAVRLPDGTLALAGVYSSGTSDGLAGRSVSVSTRVDRGAALDLLEEHTPDTVWTSWNGPVDGPGETPAQGPAATSLRCCRT